MTMNAAHASSGVKPAREVVILLVATVIVGHYLLGIILFAIDSGAVWVNVAHLGEEASEHVGWAIGAYVPVLLGFYVVIVGGGLLQVDVARTRRVLSSIAVAVTGALAPALSAIAVFTVAHPTRAGIWLVLVPVASLTVVMTIQLAQFGTFTTEEKRAQLEERARWANATLRRLRRHPQRRWWKVAAAHVTVVTVAALGTAFMLQADAITVGVLAVFIGGTLVMCNVLVASSNLVARARLDVHAARFFLGAAYVFAAGILAILSNQGVPLLTSAVIVFGPAILFDLRPRRRSGFWWSWSLKEAARTRAAIRIQTKVIPQINRERSELPIVETPSIAHRLAAAAAAWRSP